MDSQFAQEEKHKVIEWAREILSSDAVIVDLETTGLNDAAIVQIGVLDISGEVLMDKLVKPGRPIPAGATRIHGITDEMVKDSPLLNDLYIEFSILLAGKIAISYNSDYEERVISGECHRRKLPLPKPLNWQCAMKNYARFWGEWNPRRHSFAWQKLINACRQQNITVNNAHNAAADCQMTLALIKVMAAGGNKKL